MLRGHAGGRSRTADKSGPGTNRGAARFPLGETFEPERQSVGGAAPSPGLLPREQRAQAADMKKFATIAALIFAASPAAAQFATPNGQSPIQGGATGPTQAPITGVFCIEEMTANFCNVVTGPNTGGYGARSSSGSNGGSGSGPGGGPSSIPPCPAEPPFNELCN
jgi:hypothetical protein